MINALQTKRDQGLPVHFGDKIQLQHLETGNTPAAAAVAADGSAQGCTSHATSRACF